MIEDVSAHLSGAELVGIGSLRHAHPTGHETMREYSVMCHWGDAWWERDMGMPRPTWVVFTVNPFSVSYDARVVQRPNGGLESVRMYIGVQDVNTILSMILHRFLTTVLVNVSLRVAIV